ncbi:protein FAM107B-like [Rhea pennata]|uniref:protein FAM107B-like n=1 Tax=Rhea pennata TaxID=8795 RepID=UPI002E264C2D
MAFAGGAGAAQAGGAAKADGGGVRGPPLPRPLAPLSPGGAGTAGGGRMGLSQSKRGGCKAPRSGAVLEGDSSHGLTLAPATDGHKGLIQPRKVPNPVRESRRHRELHRELLFSHGRGILPRHMAELPRVLESRRLRQRRQEEQQGSTTDLEQQLRKRQQRLEEHEREAALSREPERRPEFLRVRESLRRIELSPEPAVRQT